MARIAGVNIPTNKRVIIALTYIHGIGRARSLVGSLLSIKPILHCEDGEIAPFERIRTRPKAVDRALPPGSMRCTFGNMPLITLIWAMPPRWPGSLP